MNTNSEETKCRVSKKRIGYTPHVRLTYLAPVDDEFTLEALKEIIMLQLHFLSMESWF